MKSNIVVKELRKIKNPVKAEILSRFFKTGKGEYGEGDIFLGLTTPQQKEIIKKYADLSFNDLQKLLESKIHEYRSVALGILVHKYKKAKNNNREKKKIYEF